MEFNGMTEESKAKARACKTPEEMLALASEEGYELSDDELESIAGGWGDGCNDRCHDCGEIGH